MSGRIVRRRIFFSTKSFDANLSFLFFISCLFMYFFLVFFLLLLCLFTLLLALLILSGLWSRWEKSGKSGAKGWERFGLRCVARGAWFVVRWEKRSRLITRVVDVVCVPPSGSIWCG